MCVHARVHLHVSMRVRACACMCACVCVYMQHNSQAYSVAPVTSSDPWPVGTPPPHLQCAPHSTRLCALPTARTLLPALSLVPPLSYPPADGQHLVGVLERVHARQAGRVGHKAALKHHVSVLQRRLRASGQEGGEVTAVGQGRVLHAASLDIKRTTQRARRHSHTSHGAPYRMTQSLHVSTHEYQPLSA